MKSGKWFQYDSENLDDIKALAKKFTRSHLTKRIVGEPSVEGSEIHVNVRLDDGTIGHYTFGEYGVSGYEFDDISAKWAGEIMKTLPKDKAEEYLTAAFKYYKELNDKHLQLVQEGAIARRDSKIEATNNSALTKISRLAGSSEYVGNEAKQDIIDQISKTTTRATKQVEKANVDCDNFVAQQTLICNDELQHLTFCYLEMYKDCFGSTPEKFEKITEME